MSDQQGIFDCSEVGEGEPVSVADAAFFDISDLIGELSTRHCELLRAGGGESDEAKALWARIGGLHGDLLRLRHAFIR